MKTWKEFKKYCLDNVNDNGYIALSQNWMIQVYANQRQANLCYNGESWLNVVFDGDDVVLYGCTKPGTCHYDCPIAEMPIDSEVHQLEANIGYVAPNRYARSAIEVVRDLM